jgi:hypothetical protein
VKTDALKKYKALHESLQREKASLEERLAQINDALGVQDSATSAVGTSGPRRKIRNKLSLKEAVTEVTKNKPLDKQEILQAIKKLGYRFTAKDPINSLNVVLYSKRQFKNDDGRFSPA